jgi:hypothetical protein
LSLMDKLFQSHADLCDALRLAGRQLLPVEEKGSESLERIRSVLKRADNVRKALVTFNQWPEALEDVHQSMAASASEYIVEHGTADVLLPKGVQKRNSLTRTNSLRVLKFPTG